MRLNLIIFAVLILVIIALVINFKQTQKMLSDLNFYKTGYENIVKSDGSFIILKYMEGENKNIECKEEKLEILPLHSWEFNFDKDTPIYQIVILRGQR